MSFWDSSAIVPLCVNESRSQAARRLWRFFDLHSVWSEAVVEVESAFARLKHEGGLNAESYKFASKQLAALESRWSSVESSRRVIELARTFPRTHELRALDSLQLAAPHSFHARNFRKTKTSFRPTCDCSRLPNGSGFNAHDLT